MDEQETVRIDGFLHTARAVCLKALIDDHLELIKKEAMVHGFAKAEADQAVLDIKSLLETAYKCELLIE